MWGRVTAWSTFERVLFIQRLSMTFAPFCTSYETKMHAFYKWWSDGGCILSVGVSSEFVWLHDPCGIRDGGSVWDEKGKWWFSSPFLFFFVLCFGSWVTCRCVFINLLFINLHSQIIANQSSSLNTSRRLSCFVSIICFWRWNNWKKNWLILS